VARPATSPRIGEAYPQDHYLETTAFGPEPNSDKGRHTSVNFLAQVPATSRRLPPLCAAVARGIDGCRSCVTGRVRARLGAYGRRGHVGKSVACWGLRGEVRVRQR
jgi:hypothetical protein